MKEIVGILLAAGYSRRFGADKRWHLLADGTPMALASARRLAAACGRVIAVIRPGDAALAQLLADAGVASVICEQAERGMGHSLGAGIAASAEADGWLLALADMPYIEPASYAAVLAALRDGASLARPEFNGQAGHPVGFCARHRAELLALKGDQGGKSILQAHRESLQWCPVDDPGTIRDIDRPEALLAGS